MPLDIRPITPLLGAEVDAGDLRALGPTGRASALRAAIQQHQVLFFRDQQLDHDDLLEVASLIGTPTAMEPFGFLGEGDPVRQFEIAPGSPPRADLWHTDTTFLRCPPAYGLLYNLVAPSRGGDTMWASGYGAYDSLSAPMRELCAGLWAEHTPNEGVRAFIRTRYGAEVAAAVDDAFPVMRHPLVIVHPDTGRKALFATRNFMNRIVGLHDDESALLMEFLLARFDNPNVQVRWRWRPGDLALWDERATVHRGLSDHYPTDPHRVMQSMFIGDGRAPAGQ
ncbi:MAG TPA: TauD/TfdA family dioxygenase [Acidimicrobiales bacterium]|jgi:taurine dioxygenase|nr:TauD/TfdA family dioxygenase [Acidimicrobiales bacterium]